MHLDLFIQNEMTREDHTKALDQYFSKKRSDQCIYQTNKLFLLLILDLW